MEISVIHKTNLFHEVYKKALTELSVEIKIIGVLFLKHYELNYIGRLLKEPETNKSINFMTINEIIQELIEMGVISVERSTGEVQRAVTKWLKVLEEKGLVIRIRVEEALEAGIRIKNVPQGIRYLYGISQIGIELMRYIYPYNEKILEENLLPVNIHYARKRISQLLNRRYTLSTAKVVKMGIVRKIGKSVMFFKRTPVEELVKLFPSFPVVSFYQFVEYLENQSLLTREVVKVLSGVFSSDEKVQFVEVIRSLLDYKKLKEGSDGKIQ